MADAGIGPVEEHTASIHKCDVARVEVAMHEGLRDRELAKSSAHGLQVACCSSDPSDLTGIQVREGLPVLQETVDLCRYHVKATVETAGRQQPVEVRGGAHLDPCEALDDALPDLDVGVPPEQVIAEIRKQHPPVLRLDGERRRDHAGK